jgi:hypothetical protein
MLLTWCVPSRDRALPSPPHETPIHLWIVVIVIAKEPKVLL